MSDPCRHLAWEDIRPGLTEKMRFTITARDMEDYARLSGDHNPLHNDAGFARGKGFAGPVVYGGLLVGQISRLLGMALPGLHATWTGLSVQFKSPLYVDQPAELAAEVIRVYDSTRMIHLSVRIHGPSGVVAAAKVESLYRG